MTPINKVFVLSIDSKLDRELLKKVCMTGRSSVPVYEEVDVPIQQGKKNHHHHHHHHNNNGEKVHKVMKIVGILLIKQCVLLDPKGALSPYPLFASIHVY
jgi:metal transporter CNNM